MASPAAMDVVITVSSARVLKSVVTLLIALEASEDICAEAIFALSATSFNATFTSDAATFAACLASTTDCSVVLMAESSFCPTVRLSLLSLHDADSMAAAISDAHSHTLQVGDGSVLK